ncbi:DUF11 domain-containing protein [Bacillus subtilis subsp. subtilis]|nr:DUF11 domain-containing protein [Bacillus subtilis subsp. subtilis]
MTSRESAGGVRVRLDSRRLVASSRWWALCLVWMLAAAALPATVHAAAYATGGSSPYRNTVLWLTWGGGVNGSPNQPLANGSSSSASMSVAGGVQLQVSCSLAAVNGALQSYRPGSFSGDSLDDLYNIGGTGGSNQLIAGISRASGTSTFTVNCLSTLGGVPYRLRGVVMADAESINGSGEYVQASAIGEWNVVEMRKNLGAGPYNALKSTNGAQNTVRFGPGNDNNTAAVTFLSFDDAAYQAGNLAVSMDFAINGGGTTAIAIGLLVPYADFGDAPASYGDAMHVVDDLQFRNDNLPINNTATDINTAAYTPGGLAPPLSDFLGTHGPDTEQRSSYSIDAKGDDNFPAGNAAEENAWPSSFTLSVMQANTTITQPVACNGSGTVAGWIDFNRSGAFDPGERTQAPCSGGSATLVWTVPADVAAGTTYVRLRYATNVAQILLPAGIADDGEVEDHLVTIVAPALAISKTNNSGDGIWNYGETGTVYSLTVRNTSSVATGSPPTVSAGPITVLDQLPDGIVPNWTGTLSTAGWSCTAAGQRVTCITSQILGASGSPTASSTLVLPVTVTATAVGAKVNHASVGGGHDPFNNSVAPEPGTPCTDATHCASSPVTVPTPTITYAKTASPGGPLSVGQALSYEVIVTVANGNTRDVLTLTDTLGTGLDIGSVTNAGAFTCTVANPLVCTLPANTVPGTYPLAYSATINAQASGQVVNTVVGSGGDTPTCSADCTTSTPITVPQVGYSKSSGTAGPVVLGQSITYTLTTVVSGSRTTAAVTLTDTLGTGLDFDSVSSVGAYSCNAASPLICTLPAGTVPGSYPISYTATVNAQASGQVTNAVLGSGGDNPGCVGSCTTTTPVILPQITYVKTTTAAGPVKVGDTLTYTLTATVANTLTTSVFTLTDTPGPGLDFGAVSSAGAFTCNGSHPLVCVLPAGTAPGSYPVTYTTVVNAQAKGSVTNAVVGSGTGITTCTQNCDTTTPLLASTVSYRKTSATSGPLNVGDLVDYSVTVEVANSQTLDAVTLTDTLGTGLDLVSVTNTGAFSCNTANPLVCTLPAGTVPGSYPLAYRAKVNGQATGTVRNAVLGSGGDNPTCSANCSTEHVVNPPQIQVAKSAVPAPGSSVRPGETITYTLTAVIGQSALNQPVTLVDTLGAGLRFGAVANAGVFSCSGQLECVLPAGTTPGSYAVVYTAVVEDAATGQVGNQVTATNPRGGDPDPGCSSCATTHEIPQAVVTVSKASLPAAGTTVRAGDTISYTLTVVIATSAITQPVVLNDTLGAGLQFDSVSAAGAFACSANLVCTLPAGTLPGSYSVTYLTHVAANASGPVGNVVVGEGGGGGTPSCTTCSTEHPLAEPRVVLDKTADPTSGTQVRPGDRLRYTLAATVENAALRQPLRLLDTPDSGLTIDTLPQGCERAGSEVACTLPAGTLPGRHLFEYVATVNASARLTVSNRLRGEYPDGGTPPVCGNCATTHPVVSDFALRITKTATPRRVKVGDLVSYRLVIENVGGSNWQDGIVLDTPPPGFTFVAGSLQVADDDGSFVLGAAQSPLRIGAVDIAVGRTATVTYLLRVGAGVRAGNHVNQAVAVAGDGSPLSNEATAEVQLDADPLLEDSLVFGTVFDDRDGDGWQDSAALTGVRVQGGFAPAAYIPGSTTLDRGQGPEPLADASAPLLHGVLVGNLDGRGSIADSAQDHQVVLRQRLRELAFTDDFTLASDQGAGLRMDAQGGTTAQRSGEAAKGLNAAAPSVQRQVSRVDDGFEVAYVIGNTGIHEQGIPGVRLVSVEGLIVETDQFGRYHLVDVHGGDARLGRNFILKLDPATLPDGARLTTENPLLRRVTQGVPTRFSFGVRLPDAPAAAPSRAELVLGEVLFAPGSSEVRAAYKPAITTMAEVVDRYQGGDVVISADGESAALAFARAAAVRDALTDAVAATSRTGLVVELRTQVNDPHSLLAGVTASGALLGTVLFDTDTSVVRPAFLPMLKQIAARLDAQGGGVISIVGHTDVRGSHAYNRALGLRRASAVFDALRGQLSPAAQKKTRVIAEERPRDGATPAQQEARP